MYDTVCVIKECSSHWLINFSQPHVIDASTSTSIQLTHYFILLSYVNMSSELIRELNEVFPNNPTKIKAINQNVKLAEVLLYPARTE